MLQSETIAVVLPNWIGDVVMATPALRALREHFAAARITHIGRPDALELLNGGDRAAPGIYELADKQLTDRRAQRPRPINFLQLTWGIRRERFDLAVLLPNSFRSALLCWMGGASRIAGYDRDGRGWMLSDKLAPVRDDTGRFVPTPQVDYYNALVGMLGIEVSSRRMTLSVSEAGEEEAETVLDAAGVDRSRPIVMLNPGGSFGPSKMWAPERYAAVADALVERCAAQIIVNASPAEREVARSVAEAMREPPAISFADCENTVSLLKSLMKRCSLLITNDTGARHVAAAMGIGVLTIFGSTDPRWSRIDYPRERILRADVPCAPCQHKRCPFPPGPTYHQCMKAISTEAVLEAAEELLDSPHYAAAEGAS